MIGHLTLKKTGRRAAWAALLLACVGLLRPPATSAADGADADVSRTRATLEKWVQTRRVISREKRDLALTREMLNERIALIQREIDSLRAKIADAEKSIATADKKRDEMLAENARLKEASASLVDVIGGLEARTKALLKRAPTPIVERVKPLTQRFREDPSDTKAAIAERFQNVVGALNEVNKFHGEVSVTSEVRRLPDGGSAEVTAMYLGVGYAFYAGANGTVAGFGAPGADGWVWTPLNEAAADIDRAIAILNNEQVASFVRLPITIH